MVIPFMPPLSGIVFSIDVGLLTECDDEYWTTSEGKLSFEQPPDKPSKITAFNCLIRLTKILAYAHQTLVRTQTSFLFCHSTLTSHIS